MALNLPDPNREVGDSGHTSDTNLIIDAINTLKGEVDAIPQGPQGPQGEPGTPGAAGANASVNIGSTTTGAPGSSASVTNSGTEQNAVFNFTIPQGATGAAGAAGAQGPQGPKGDTGETGPVGPTGVVAANSPLTYDTLNRTINLDVDALQLDPDQVTGLDPTGQTGKFVGTLDGSGLDWITSTATTSWGSIAGTLSDQTDLQTALNNKAPSTGIDPSAITGTAVVDSDARLTNERTPTDGSVTEAKIATGAVTSDKIANGTIVDADVSGTAAISPSKINGTAVVDSDSRLTDTRTPTDGTVTDVKITAGGLSPSSITGTAVITSDSRLSDARTPTTHATSHESGGSDELELAAGQITGTAVVQTDLSSSNPQNTGTAAPGVATTVSRSDHVHSLPDEVPAEAIQFDTTPSVTDAAGKVYWDTDFGTLAVVMAGGNVALPVGQKAGATVKNKQISQINKGQAVQFDSASGGNIEVDLATNDGTVNPRLYFGIAAENIASDGTGFVVSTGYIRGFDTTGMALGDLLYIDDSTPGLVTKTQPSKPAFITPIAVVTLANSANGVIYVRMDSGVELNEIFDVEIDTPTAGQVLAYDDVDGVWKNQVAAAPVDDPFPVGMFLGGM